MRILAMDTATSACSVALKVGGDIVERRFEQMARGQAEALVPMIDDVLTCAEVRAEELDLIAVSQGPGAFTGIRIGLAAARGLSLAADVPCLGLTTTEAIAHGVPAIKAGALIVALDSKRADIFIQVFDPDLAPLMDAEAVAPENLASRLSDIPGPLNIVGDAAAVALDALEGLETAVIEGHTVPDAAILAELAAGRFTPGDDISVPAPLYLRPPDAKLPRDGGRLRP